MIGLLRESRTLLAVVIAQAFERSGEIRSIGIRKGITILESLEFLLNEGQFIQANLIQRGSGLSLNGGTVLII